MGVRDIIRSFLSDSARGVILALIMLFSFGERLCAEDFVNVSLIVASPGTPMHSSVGHAALRMECKEYDLDYCFNYNAESCDNIEWRFFRGTLKSSMIAMKTEAFLDMYRHEGRGVWEYRLTLPDDVKRDLWQLLDEEMERGFCYRYDIKEYGCAKVCQRMVESALGSEHEIVYGSLPSVEGRTYHDIVSDCAPQNPWAEFVAVSIVGSDGDSMEPACNQLYLPKDLVAMWQSSTVDGRRLCGEGKCLLAPTTTVPSQIVTPMLIAIICGIICLLSRRFTLFVWLLLGVTVCYMWLGTELDHQKWNWLLVVYNPVLPFVLLSAVKQKWRRVVALWLLCAVVICVCWPHRLVDSSLVVLTLFIALKTIIYNKAMKINFLKNRKLMLMALLCLPMMASADPALLLLYDTESEPSSTTTTKTPSTPTTTTTATGKDKVYKPKEKSTYVFTKAPSSPTGYENGHPYVDLGLGVKWAYCNVGATKPEGFGDSFQWGDTQPKNTWNVDEYEEREDVQIPQLPPHMDAAHVHWGGEWRMPTYDEVSNMSIHCEFKEGTYNGVYGMMVTGPNGNTIFMPQSKVQHDNISECPIIYYWTSTAEEWAFEYGSIAYGMDMDELDELENDEFPGYFTLPVRAVCVPLAKTSVSQQTTSTSSYSGSSSYTTPSYRSSYRGSFNENKNPENIAMTMGYVQKSYQYEDNGATQRYGMFDDQKFLNGIQVGITFDPQLGAGFGIHTGLNYEYFWAESDEYVDDDGYLIKNSYDEHNIYVPVHLKYNFNFNEYFQLGVFGGIGLDCIVDGRVNWLDCEYDNEKYYSVSILEDFDQKRFNASWEVGASVRIKNVMLDFTTSHGLVNHAMESTYKVKQNKPLRIGLSIFF